MTVQSPNAPLVLTHWHDRSVVVLRLNREEKRNALSNRLLAELAAAVKEAEARKDARCIVLTGSETVFSAGSDIREINERGLEAIHNHDRSEAWRLIEGTKLPVIAAVSGVCFGGGHELAMLADIVVASQTAQFGQPEVKLGHIPGDGATQRLIRLTGKYNAMRMILTGEPVSAEEALRLGLAVEVVPVEQCLPRALELAGLISRHSSVALTLAKDAVLCAQELPLSLGLGIERRNIAHAFTSADQKEGLAAFFERRRPDFKDE